MDSVLNFNILFLFFAQLDPNQSIQYISINNDEDLINFFDTLEASAEVKMEFPLILLGIDGSETQVNSLTELEEILEVVVDACRGEDEYEYCHDNNKKVYVCHNGKTICVSINAIKAHLDHGDELGKCDDDDNDEGN